jgi:beta-glucosidase
MIDAYEVTSYYEGIKNNAPAGIQVDYLPVEGICHLDSKINKQKFSKEIEKTGNYDAVVLCVGFDPKTEGEGFDRPFNLPEEQNVLIEEVTKNQKNTILVINSGGGVFMPWIKKTKAILHTWYPGQDGGSALGELLFGKINPSGKLPVSIEKLWKDNAAYKTYDTVHAVPGAKPFYTLYGRQHPVEHMKYGEGIFTGYRHYDTKGIEPLFHFGFGLSYTDFELSDLRINRKSIKKGKKPHLELTVKNTGNYDGAETVQLYIHDVKSSLPRPAKELKAFKKVFLKAGETRKISFDIGEEMLGFYHPEEHQWITEEGDFELLIGNSSGNILLKQKIKFIK